MIKLIAFDLDGTLTQHKSKLDEVNRNTLFKLSKKYKLVIVGAGGCSRIYAQIKEFPLDILGNYGMQESTIENGSLKIIRNDSYEVDKNYFEKGANLIRSTFPEYKDYVGENVEFHDSGMVTFPFLGTKANIADKVAFDPDRRKRAVVYPLAKKYFEDFTVFIGGSSSFDIVSKKYDKFNALKKYCEQKNIDIFSEVVFFGDDFGEGGNDEQIKLGGVKHVFVEKYTDFPKYAQFLLND